MKQSTKQVLQSTSTIILSFILFVWFLAQPIPARSDTYMVTIVSQDLRLVLSGYPCPNNEPNFFRAALQRIDGAYVRGCWTRDDSKVYVGYEDGTQKDYLIKDFVPVEE